MFTGIIQTLGRLESIKPCEGGRRLAICPLGRFDRLAVGESISVDGVCLTVEPESAPGRLVFFVSDETLSKTTLGDARADALVNLERSLAAGDRIGGHFVMGHVDGTGRIARLDPRGEGWELEVEFPQTLAPLIAPKGSIAVDGISLTVVEAQKGRFSVAIIPHTYEQTSLKSKKTGSRVNLEADPLARYVAAYLRGANDPGPPRGSSP